MKQNRLELLYKRPLVPGNIAAREFPLEHVLKKELIYFPAKPEKPDYDILEIGPGRGDFLFHLARANPDKKILAIEKARDRIERLKERIKKQELFNITLIGGDAFIAFLKDLEEARFEKIYVLFPDPWPRNRHRYKRLLTEAFTRQLCEKLTDDGTFTFATDVKDYLDWVLLHLGKIPFMQNSIPVSTERPAEELIPTFFEQKWKTMGRTCLYAAFKKAN